VASEQEREDMALQREQWREFQAGAESSRLVFIDESGAQTNMSRLYGRARQGQRCYDKAPCRWKTVTVLSSIRLDGETESVEKMWSKIKQILRGIKARTPEELFEAIAKALDKVSSADAKGGFQSCGYV
jgi:hypothetical protein